MATNYVGAPLKRLEDPKLITGQDPYVADVPIQNALYMAVARSPLAHAVIRSINTEAAKKLPGVVAVVTGADVNPEFGIIHTGLPPQMFLEMNRQGRYALAEGRVRYVGEPIAVVVAENPRLAADGVDAIVVDYQPLPAVTDPDAALRPGSPLLYEESGSNVAIRLKNEKGDVDQAFTSAAVVVEARLVNQRLIPIAMEPRATSASWDEAKQQLTVWTSTQVPHRMMGMIAQFLKLPPERVHLLTARVGGGFGAKTALYSEDLLVPWLARRLRRPVRWAASRREDIQSTAHGRDIVAQIRVAADRSGRVLAVDARIVANLGFCLFAEGPLIPMLVLQMITGCYDIQTARVDVVGAFTNTMGTAPYRGAGRPEAAYFIERMMDLLAARLKMDPAEIRKKNFIAPNAFPYTTPGGAVYDSGEYAKTLDTALEKAGYQRLRAEQAQARKGGRLMGIGLASYVEIGGFYDEEVSDVVVGPDGRVTVLTGTASQGQGHETAYAQLVADALHITPDLVTVIHGDTSRVRGGVGTFGSRSLARGGMHARGNAQRVREKARRIAAHLLEAGVEDVVDAGSDFQVKGVPNRFVTWTDVAKGAHGGRLPAELGPGLESREDLKGEGPIFPYGSHVAVVEVDRETGQARLQRYISIDDSGLIVNPLLAGGQVHGGLAQGIGQALWEQAVYDANGQLLSGTLMDYSIPKADDLISFENAHTVTLSPRTPLGVKGIGESATIGSTPAIANAVLDALAPLGIEHIDIPFTPDKIWKAISSSAK